MKHRSVAVLFAGSFALMTAGCSGPPPAAPAATTSSPAKGSETDSTATTGACVLDCGTAAVVTHEDAVVVSDENAADVRNVNEVFGAMHGDLLACYGARLSVDANAHASMTVDIVLAPDGHVRSVTTTGGAPLGEVARRCITHRIERARFAPVRGGGTLHVQVPLSFRRAGREST